MADKTMLHVHCGDYSADSLRSAGVPGDVMVWCDPLVEGPTPAGLEGRFWWPMRARALSEGTGGAVSVEQCMQMLTDQQKRLEGFVEYDELVFWFDACLFDMTILLRQLDWLAVRHHGTTRISLILAGEYPGREVLIGLGKLKPEELAGLLPTRSRVTRTQLMLAQVAWAAYRCPDPTRVEELIHEDLSAIPYLKEALQRNLERFPWGADGLNRMQRSALEALDEGHTDPGAIFKAVSSREHRPFFGDTMLWACLQELADCPQPLVAVSGPGRLPSWNEHPDLKEWTLTITETGRQVLAGKADHIQLNGIDRWVGGVHLVGPCAAWRWDPEVGHLCPNDNS